MRVVTAAEAVAGIRSGDQLYLHCAAATPSVLLDALVGARARAATMSAWSTSTRGPGAASGARDGGHFRHRALFIGPNARAAVNEGRADYVPGLPVRRAAPVRVRRRCRSTPSS